MSTPYLRRGLALGDLVVTSTTMPYTTDELRPNDLLISTGRFNARSGATPFTGAYYHTAQWSTGYVMTKPMSLDNPAEMTEFLSGDRDATRRRYPRQQLQITVTNATEAEVAELVFFFQHSIGEVVELVDEHGNAIPGRITSGLSYPKDKKTNAAAPFNVSFTFEAEHVSKKYTIESGGLISY